MLALAAAQVLIGAMFFLWFASMRKKAPNGEAPGLSGLRNFEIFKRNDKLIAIQKEQPFQLWSGLIYAGGFYFVVPILIWRYGALRALGMLAIPIGIGAAIAVPIGGSEGMGLGMLVALILRGWIGVFIAKKDLSYYRVTLIRRGWSSAGFLPAKDQKSAVKQFQAA